jgi:hypothetical protein
MKTLFQKPGFEFIFSLSLILILALPPVLLAQSTKNLEIKIENGDTTVNGTNIKQLSADDRSTALTDISHINGTSGQFRARKFTWRHTDTLNGANHTGMQFRTMRDSMRTKPGREMAMNYNRRMDKKDVIIREDFNDRMRMARAERRNTQNFDYVNINNDGVSTHVRYHVSEANNDDLKRMPYVEGAKFELKDLSIVPEFSTGKTLIMFSLASKAPAEVKLHDSEGKLVWSEKAVNGNFSKTSVLGLNGIYYLQIKQGSSFALRKIMKEE